MNPNVFSKIVAIPRQGYTNLIQDMLNDIEAIVRKKLEGCTDWRVEPTLTHLRLLKTIPPDHTFDINNSCEGVSFYFALFGKDETSEKAIPYILLFDYLYHRMLNAFIRNRIEGYNNSLSPDCVLSSYFGMTIFAGNKQTPLTNCAHDITSELRQQTEEHKEWRSGVVTVYPNDNTAGHTFAVRTNTLFCQRKWTIFDIEPPTNPFPKTFGLGSIHKELGHIYTSDFFSGEVRGISWTLKNNNLTFFLQQYLGALETRVHLHAHTFLIRTFSRNESELSVYAEQEAKVLKP